ncbi:hypothetical protein Vadar_019293 [Vaccinium darrowii]|uniref:Uncharacterized protein n=1 Tax=Vaccinium darrowii TaxID=229202 RepID=A0ACB7Y0E9_9ERIC|nr:hypothetical protein Vadar_019293 [Vaccinium darrowii]
MEGVIMSDSRRVIVARVIGIFVVMARLVYTSKGLNSDGLYLLEFKKNIHDEFNILGNWNPCDRTPCGWKGVNCTTDYYNPVVESLDLSSMNLLGTLTPNICNLVNLTILDVSDNGFTGRIPMEIGNCSRLESLYLNNNQFRGYRSKLSLASLLALVCFSSDIRCDDWVSTKPILPIWPAIEACESLTLKLRSEEVIQNLRCGKEGLYTKAAQQRLELLGHNKLEVLYTCRSSLTTLVSKRIHS